MFFTRDTKRADWTDCDTLVLPGSETDFPPNTVRLINLSDHPTIALINEERVALRPGSVQFAPFTGERVTIKGAFLTEERWRVLLNTRIASGDNSRINIVFYPRRSERTPAAASVQPISSRVPERDPTEEENDSKARAKRVVENRTFSHPPAPTTPGP